jgi:hypothetical protein
MIRRLRKLVHNLMWNSVAYRQGYVAGKTAADYRAIARLDTVTREELADLFRAFELITLGREAAEAAERRGDEPERPVLTLLRPVR